MKLYFWTLCIFCHLLSADNFGGQGFVVTYDHFDGTVNETAAKMQVDTPVFAPPSGNGFSASDFQIGEKEVVPEASTGMASVIDSVMVSNIASESMGENYFKRSVTGKDIKELKEEEENIYDAAPARERSLEEIAGITEVNVEDLLSSRGLPRVNSANTSLDILGLPKPAKTAYDYELRVEKRDTDPQAEKVKAKFMDIFNTR